jgi:hypothetical protein
MTMELYTIAIPQWRKARDRHIELVDITVKSGFEPFAPYKDVLYAYKRGEVTDEQYTAIYLDKLTARLRGFPEDFQTFLEKPGPLAVACYCTAGKFCHRHLFVDFIKTVGDDNGYTVRYHGEIL